MDLHRVLDRTLTAARRLPGVEPGTSYGTPALKVRGRLIARVKDAETLVVACAPEQKELLLEAAPGIYFETDHYKGYPLVLVRLSAIAEDELAHRLEQAWRAKAPRALVQQFDAASG